MRYAYHRSFLRTTEQLSRHHATLLLKAVEKFQRALEAGQWPRGLGITHLRGDYFEFRVDLHIRIIYRRRFDLIEYVLYGTHDDVRRFLKSL